MTLDTHWQERRPDLAAGVVRQWDGMTPEGFGALLDSMIQRLLSRGFERAGGHEGTVWILDDEGECLVPVFNSGPDASRFVFLHKQPLGAGLICMVFASEQPFIENDVSTNSSQSKLLDRKLSTQTHALIAVPYYAGDQCRGVVSCVQLKKPGSTAEDPRGFEPEDLREIEEMSAVMTRLIEYQLLLRVLSEAPNP